MVRPELITFDCYGTLIDWNAGICGALRTEGARQGFPVHDRDILGAYHAAEPRVQAEEYRTYREVLTLLESEVAAELDWQPPETPGYLADSVASWRPFADTNEALERLTGAGFRLGILSNIDDDLLAATLMHFNADFDVLVTAQQMRSYKPRPAHFLRALELVDGRPDRLLHMAQSYYHDIRPGEAHGIRTVWINRLAEQRPGDGPEPFGESADLRGGVDWLEEQLGSLP